MAGFADRYGFWVVVAGASDGVGAAAAWALARNRVRLVLFARRQAVLDATHDRRLGWRDGNNERNPAWVT